MKYEVNHRCDKKNPADMTDDEIMQVINHSPVYYSGGSTMGCHAVPHDIYDEWVSRAERKKLLGRLKQGAC